MGLKLIIILINCEMFSGIPEKDLNGYDYWEYPKKNSGKQITRICDKIL